MAASLLRREWRTINYFCKNIFYREAYIVLLPEIPNDTAYNNPVLQLEPNPPFKSITAENCVNAIGKLVINYECNLNQLTGSMKVANSNALNVEKSFSSIIEPLESLSASLDYAWSITKLMYLVQHSEKMANTYKGLFARVQKAHVQRFLNLPIYHCVRELNADKKQLNEVQQRVVKKYLLEARLKGIDLSASQQEHFSVVLGKLAQEKDVLRRKVQEATRKYLYLIDNKEVVKNFPEPLLRLMAVDRVNPTRGPWKVTLQPEVYNGFMKYCCDRTLRWNTWFAYVTRASTHNDSTLNTSINIEEIRFQRQDEAKLLGFDNFAHMSMETKMAGSVKNVKSMITTLHKWSKPAMEQELTELQKFAVSKGFEGKLELWDIPYWEQQQKDELFGIDENDFRLYFPLPKVLDGLFALCKNLFGIVIKECTREVETWDNSVTYYKVFDNDGVTHLGSFYLDPYMRPRGKVVPNAWIECGPSGTTSLGMKPTSYLLLNIMPPTHGRPAFLNFDEINHLFQKFGHCLQHVLTTIPYGEVAGLTNIEWDAVEICPQVMSYLLLEDSTLELISSHHESGNSLPKSIAENLRRSRVHMAGFHLTHNLYLSSLDLQLYSTKDFWVDIMKQNWGRYMPFPLDKKDSHPCSFTTIFSDDYAAAYYSFKWAEMIAADVYSAFSEASEENTESVRDVGRRFRDTFLSLGGGCHPSEIFRRFRGRDPSPDALLKSYDLKD